MGTYPAGTQTVTSISAPTTAFVSVDLGGAVFARMSVANLLANSGAAGSFTTLTATGLATLTGGQTEGGARKFVMATVKATGNSVANARTVGSTSSVIVVNASASAEGVKLPTPSTGLSVSIVAPSANGVTVYAANTGQSIGAGTTNTTGFVVTKNTTLEFIATSTTHWRIGR